MNDNGKNIPGLNHGYRQPVEAGIQAAAKSL
jgi:hypothetical protein